MSKLKKAENVAKTESSSSSSLSDAKAKGKSRLPRDAVFWQVLNAALELDFKRGHLKWTMSELSRKSGITRSLIYYHFGRSKIAIIDQAVSVIGEEVVGISPQRMSQWKRGEWTASLMQTRDVLAQSPNLANFYLLHRERPTDVGRSLKALEINYRRKIQTMFPHIQPVQQRALFALFFGVAFAPGVDTEVIESVVAVLKKTMGGGDTNIILRTGATLR